MTARNHAVLCIVYGHHNIRYLKGTGWTFDLDEADLYTAEEAETVAQDWTDVFRMQGRPCYAEVSAPLDLS